MSTLRRLTKESWRFYLPVLIIILFLVICDSLYICRDAGVVFTKTAAEQQLQAKIAEAEKTGTTFQVSEQGRDLLESICDKADNYSILGFGVTIAGIVFLMILRRLSYMDIRAEEFRRTLPVKERSMIIYDYFCMLGVILAAALVQGTILLGGQTCYNRNLMELAPKYSAGTVADSAVMQANQRLLLYMMCYLLFVLLLYTWIYLGMTVVKNPILGAVVSIFNWQGLYSFENYYMGMLLGSCYNDGNYDVLTLADRIGVGDRLNIISDFMDSLFSPSVFFGYYIKNSTILTGNAEGYHIWLNAVVMAVALVMGILLIVFLGGRRELSKGKLFYFPILDYPFAFLCGIMVFIFLNEVVLWYLDGVIAMVIGFVAAVMVCLWIHPLSKKKSEKWEVK